MKFKLTEDFISDSKYTFPNRMSLTVYKNRRRSNSYNIVKLLKPISMNVEILLDNSDGTYQLCVPTIDEWKKVITETLQNNLPKEATFRLRDGELPL